MDRPEAPGEPPRERGDEVRVDAGEKALGQLDQRDFGAERRVDRAELEPDVAPSDDEEARRDERDRERLRRVPDSRTAGIQPREHDGARTGRDDRVLDAEGGRRPVLGRDDDGVARPEARLTGHDLDAARASQAGEPLSEPGDRARRETPETLGDDCGRRELDPRRSGLRRVGHERGEAQQGFRRDAPDVETLAAERPARLDQHGFDAEVGGSERGRVAARAAADHDEVDVTREVPHHHGRNPRATARLEPGPRPEQP
jgi:hypothetical protein